MININLAVSLGFIIGTMFGLFVGAWLWRNKTSPVVEDTK